MAIRANKLWENVPVHKLAALRLNGRYILVLGAVCFVLLLWFFADDGFVPLRNAYPAERKFDGSWAFERDAHNLQLNDSMCDAAFPELYAEIDRALALRKKKHITIKEIDEVPIFRGYVRAMIFDQQLYMLAAGDEVNTRNQATLMALHRAILTSPSPLPNIEFTLNSDDIAPDHATWAYARRPEMDKIWVMPDFGYWSWPEPKVGAYGEIQKKAMRVDSKVAWKDKINKVVWRGAMMGLKVREDLLKNSEGKGWSDIKKFVWADDSTGATHDSLTMDQHCQYKYVVHTEGVSYSARLQNLQNCRSILVSHKLGWIEHHTHLMRKSGFDQNYVEVAADFSDLDQKMEAMLARDKAGEAEMVAENSVKTFRDRYLTPAAEACYWRKLIRAWALVSPDPRFYKTNEQGEEVWRGLPIESYLLERRMTWDLH